MSLFPSLSGAHFSPCGRYRYLLWRYWDDNRPPALFVMLNPSTADEIDNDPTVERCQRRAKALGFGGIRVVNIFALRSTDPAALYEAQDPIGPENDEVILEATIGAGLVICAWGTHGNFLSRGKQVMSLFHRAGVMAHCLQLNADGTPQHPLYIAYEVMPKPMPMDFAGQHHDSRRRPGIT